MRTIYFIISLLLACSSAMKAQPQKITIGTKKDYQLKGDVKQLVIVLWMILLTTASSAQQFKWPPRSFPLSVPCKVSAEVDYYWNVQQITCTGRANGGYKFRISGIAKHDHERSQSIDIYYIAPGNRLAVAGSYFFPGIKKGQKFSFDITSAFSGYIPSGFKGFFIHDKWLTVPKETPTPEDILKSVDMKKANVDSERESDTGMAVVEPVTVEVEQMPVFPGGASEQNGEFRASAPGTVAVGDHFWVNYRMEAENIRSFKAPSFSSFEVLMGPTTFKSTTKINGSLVTKPFITYTYILQAQKEGNFTVSGAIAEFNGKTYTSNSVTIKVTPN